MDNVIIYCRKSAKPKNSQEKLEEGQILSLESQEQELKRYAVQQGFQIVKIFKENESAYKAGRPQFAQMIKMMEEGKAEHILVFALSRISRNSYEGGRVIYLLDEGILKSIITPQKRYYNTSEDKFILSIELAMAKKSSDDTSSFVRNNIKTKASNGEFPGKAPLGYLNINKEGHIAGRQFDSAKQILLEEKGRTLKRIEIDPIDGLLISQLFEEAAKGTYSLSHLCDYAFKLGIRADRNGKELVKSSLQRTLSNPFYYGAFLWEGKLYTSNIKHDALISKELFDNVQEALNCKSFKKKTKIAYKFSGLMRCEECDSGISSQIQKGIMYYYCTAYKAKREGGRCNQRKYFEESVIEEKMVDLLKTVEIPSEFVEWGKSVIRDSYKEESVTHEAQRLADQKNLNLAKRRLSNLFQLKISPQNDNGTMLSDEEYLAEKKNIQTEINELEVKLANVSSNETNWLNNCEEFFDYASRLQQNFIDSSTEGQRAIIGSIGKIVMNNGEMAFKLKEPYLYAAEIVKAFDSLSEIYEPQKELVVANNPIYAPILDKWRDRRDSNPRPPA